MLPRPLSIRLLDLRLGSLFDDPTGVLNQVLSGGLRLKVQPLTLLYTIFDTKGTPFVYLLLTNGAPFTYLV